jgi:hypothetical protein
MNAGCSASASMTGLEIETERCRDVLADIGKSRH